MKRAIDLHIHTTASDGSCSPSEVVNIAVKAGLCAIAITDHDSVDGVEEAATAAAGTGLEVVPGVEISVGDTDDIHILGYYIDTQNSRLSETLEILKESRERRNRQLIKRLREEGFDITYDEVKEHTGAVNMGRLHIAQTLKDKGMISDYRKLFKNYIGIGQKNYVKREKISEREGIEAIKAAGGLAFLAHINYIKKPAQELDFIVKKLKSHGLDGIEAYYSGYTPQTEAAAISLAERNGLLKSGGTDFHGVQRKGVYMGTGRGNMCVPYSLLEEIKRAAGKCR